jgi:hypothetical protein
MLKPAKLGVKPPKITPRLIVSDKKLDAPEVEKLKRQTRKSKG